MSNIQSTGRGGAVPPSRGGPAARGRGQTIGTGRGAIPNRVADAKSNEQQKQADIKAIERNVAREKFGAELNTRELTTEEQAQVRAEAEKRYENAQGQA